MSADDPTSSEWTRASGGIYGLTLEELRLLILSIRETYETTGRWPTSTELRIALRRPGL